MRFFLTAALIPAATSAHVLGTARTAVALRATSSTMLVQSWYDQGVRLPVADVKESLSDKSDGSAINLPAGMSASVAAANPQFVEKALAYEADIANIQARLDAFQGKEGTMVGACAATIQQQLLEDEP